MVEEVSGGGMVGEHGCTVLFYEEEVAYLFADATDNILCNVLFEKDKATGLTAAKCSAGARYHDTK
eukprot:7874052-Pyramimonas_sp.AAC.1